MHGATLSRSGRDQTSRNRRSPARPRSAPHAVENRESRILLSTSHRAGALICAAVTTVAGNSGIRRSICTFGVQRPIRAGTGEGVVGATLV